MPRPTLLQAIFHQPTQTYVANDTVYTHPAPPPTGWRSSALLRRSRSARTRDNSALAKPDRGAGTPGPGETGSCTGLANSTYSSKSSARPRPHPPAFDMHKATIVDAVPTLSFLPSPSLSPLSSVTASPSATPILVSPASTPKSCSPSLDDSDSCTNPEFYTPPDSPSPSAALLDAAPTAVLPDKRPAIISSDSCSSSSDQNSLFDGSPHSSDTEPSSRRSSPVSEPKTPTSTSPIPSRIVRPTPLRGVPDWDKDNGWLFGPQPAARRAALFALADPNYVPVRPRAVTAPARTGPSASSSSRRGHSIGPHNQAANAFNTYPSRPVNHRRGSKRMRATTEVCRSGYRMSALVEVSESEEVGAEIASDGLSRKRSTSQQRASRARPLSIRSSSSTSSSRTIVLPTPLPVTSGVGPHVGAGYTSLVLARAAYTPSVTPTRPTSVVDLTRSGLAQTTMTTISVIRGASRTKRFSMTSSLNSSRSSIPSSSSSRNSSVISFESRLSVPLALRLADLEDALAISSHTAPPSKIQGSQVIVQIHAVALDALDVLIISERMGKGGSEGAGFVPGRSFVGRAVECGFEVSGVSRGDWVIGLTDMRKCGALAEFVVVDKRRVCTIPKPTERLTTTQYALLPLCAVPAHRAMRTIPNGTRRGMRGLVLQAHDGPGALAVQAMRAQGMRVTAQVPSGSPIQAMDGVEVVVGDDPLEVVTRLEEGVYDVVVDTVGGRGVWGACRRIMSSDAHFTTLVGDSNDTIPSFMTNAKSSFRSLKRAFAKHDKALAYQCVSPAADQDHEGEDIKHSLGAVAQLAAAAAYNNGNSAYGYSMLPQVTCSFPFERAPDAFTIDDNGRGPLINGGTVVVRVL